MAIEHRIRSLGTKFLTYPWMRRYIVISPLVNGSVRQTVVASATARATNSAADKAAARRKPKPGPDSKG